MTFHEVRFPVRIAFGSAGGPERRTEIVQLASGGEERNAVWANSRRRYDVGYGATSIADVHMILSFFEARLGRLYGFRFKDWTDYKSCAPDTAPQAIDQAIGAGDGAMTSFALAKTYTSGGSSWPRAIAKPVAGTVRVAVDGMELAAEAFAVDTTTGLVTLATPPLPGKAVTAGYEFDVPVRFDSDMLSINLADFRVGELPAIPIVEIRP